MSILFNNISSDLYGLKILDIRRTLSGDMDDVSTNRKAGDGIFYQTSYMQERDFQITFLIENASTKNELYERLTLVASWLYTNNRQPKPLKFIDASCGEPLYTYYAYPTGDFRINEILSTGRFVVRFRCFDPFKYKDNVTIPINGAGDTILNLTNTADSTGVFTYVFTTAQTNFKIEHVEKGEYIETIYNYSIADELVIDFTRRYVTLNGNNHMVFLKIASIFFTLSLGVNTIRIPAINIDDGEYILSPKYF